VSLRGEVTGVKIEISGLTEKGPDSADHFFGAEGFGDVTDGADLSSAQDVGGKASCREHDDWQVLGPGVATQTRSKVETVSWRRKSDIEEHQIHVLLTQEVLGVLGGWRLKGDITLPTQFEGQDSPDMRLILNNQNSAPHIRKCTALGF